jgi:hypothetical protein
MRKLFFYCAILILPLMLVGAARDVRQSAKETQNQLGTPTITLEDHSALGHVPGVFTINKFGYNAAITGAPEESVWDVPDLGGPLRCFALTDQTPAVMYISSSAAGDATESITIEGLTTGYVAQTATVALGATAATTGTVLTAAGTWLRINRMYAASTAVTGDIYVANVATDTDTDGIPDDLATIVAAITAGENQTLQGCFTVPAGYVAVLTDFCVSNGVEAGANTLDFRVRTSIAGAASRTKNLFTVGAADTLCQEINPPMVFTEKTDIEFTGSGITQPATATFGMILIPEAFNK